MTDSVDMPVVNMTNTKKEMIEAYEAMKARLQAQEKELLNAGQKRKQMEKSLSAATADAQASQDPVQRLSVLRSDISRDLTVLADRFEQEIDAYNKIKAAIKSKKEDLDTIYGVEAAASDLAALIEAQQVKRDAFDAEITIRKSALEAEMQETSAAWKKEKTAKETEVKEFTENLKKQRQREKEEFEYRFAREKEQRKNTLDDELKSVEKDILEKREDFEQEYSRRKRELDAREEEIGNREKKMDVLKEEADTFPKRLEAAVAKSVKDTTAHLTRDFEKDKILMESKFEGKKNVLQSRLESLENLVTNQAAQIADLAKGREDAYGKVQDIANRAISAAKREIISVPVATRASASDEDRKG